MAGGEGSRFAPLSTPEFPKQFLNLIDPNHSLFQQTLKRLEPISKSENFWITTNERYLALVEKQSPTLSRFRTIGEPYKKNTCPGIALVAKRCFESDPESLLIVLPSDHYIPEEQIFCNTLQKALDLAQKTKGIVTLGKTPTWPATQFGYIQSEENRVKRFVEKPNTSKAREYMNDGHYFWNLGMFIFPTRIFLGEVQKHLPELHEALAYHDNIQQFYELAPNISIDYGIMEKTDRAHMIEASFTWYDLGTWESLNDLVQKEKIRLDPKIGRMLQEQLTNLHSAKIAPIARQV